jgi:hypothetical protein
MAWGKLMKLKFFTNPPLAFDIVFNTIMILVGSSACLHLDYFHLPFTLFQTVNLVIYVIFYIVSTLFTRKFLIPWGILVYNVIKDRFIKRNK